MNSVKVIRLFSNVQSQSIHENTVAHFITDLKQPFDETGEWVVGVSEVSYTRSWLESLRKPELVEVVDDEVPFIFNQVHDLDAAFMHEVEKLQGESSVSVNPGIARNPANQQTSHLTVDEPVPVIVEADKPTPVQTAEESLREEAIGEAQTEDKNSDDEREEKIRQAIAAQDRIRAQSMSRPRPPPQTPQPPSQTQANIPVTSTQPPPSEEASSGGSAAVEPTIVHSPPANNENPVHDDLPTIVIPEVAPVEPPPPPPEDTTIPLDHENELIQPVGLHPLEIPSFSGVEHHDIYELYRIIGEIANYRGVDQGVRLLKNLLIAQCVKVYGPSLSDEDKTQIRPEAMRLMAEAKLLRNIIMGTKRESDYTGINTSYRFAKTQTIHASLKEYLKTVLEVDISISTMKRHVKKFLENEIPDGTLKAAVGYEYEQLPEMRADHVQYPGAQLANKNNVLNPLYYLLPHYKAQMVSLTNGAKRNVGEEMYTYITANRDKLDPLAFRILYDLTKDYRLLPLSRKRRGAAQAGFQDIIDDAATLIQPDNYPIEILVKKINEALMVATDIYQQKKRQSLYSMNDERPSSLRAPPRLKYDVNKDLVQFMPGLVLFHEQRSGSGWQATGAKIYPKFSRDLCCILGFVPKVHEARSTIKDALSVPRGAGFFSLLLYSNIVKHTPVADTASKLLRLVEIPSRSHFGEQVTLTYDKPQFYPLSHNYFKQIEIKFLDDTNHIIPFQFGRSFVTLVFKRIDN